MTRRGREDHPFLVGVYPVTGVLGAGSFGTVYLGRHPATGVPVAVKVFMPDRVQDPGFRSSLRGEIKAMRGVDDPHCVSVVDLVDDGDLVAIVTNLVDGASLRAVLSKAGRLTGPQALDVLRGALLGLIAVHDSGLVHGDFKPDNILVDRRGVSQLIDFGLTQKSGSALRADGSVAGSPAYMSPEQIQGRLIDGRSDLYACAAVLFELLTGRRPFTGAQPAEVLRKHVGDPVPDPREIDNGLGAALARVCMTGLAKDPDDRFATASDFLAALEDAAATRYGAAWRTGLGLGALAGAAAAVTVQQFNGGQTLPSLADAGAPSDDHPADGNPATKVARPPRVTTPSDPTSKPPGSHLKAPPRVISRTWVGGTVAAAVTATVAMILIAVLRSPPPHQMPTNIAATSSAAAPTVSGAIVGPSIVSPSTIPAAAASGTEGPSTATSKSPVVAGPSNGNPQHKIGPTSAATATGAGPDIAPSSGGTTGKVQCAPAADMNSQLPPLLPGASIRVSDRFDVQSYLSRYDNNPQRDRPLFTAAGLTRGLVRFANSQDRGETIYLWLLRSPAAANKLLKDLRAGPPGPGNTQIRAFTVPGIPGATGSQFHSAKSLTSTPYVAHQVIFSCGPLLAQVEIGDISTSGTGNTVAVAVARQLYSRLGG